MRSVNSITAVICLAAISSVQAAPVANDTGASKPPAQPSNPIGGLLNGLTSLFSNPGEHFLNPQEIEAAAKDGGGLGEIDADLQIVPDHMKYSINPPISEEPIPAAQNSQFREAHRKIHVGLYEAANGGNPAPMDIGTAIQLSQGKSA